MQNMFYQIANSRTNCIILQGMNLNTGICGISDK